MENRREEQSQKLPPEEKKRKEKYIEKEERRRYFPSPVYNQVHQVLTLLVGVVNVVKRSGCRPLNFRELPSPS